YNNLYIKMPKIALKADLDIIMKKLDSMPKSVGIYADNLYHYYIAAIQNRPVLGGLGLNIYNSEVVRFLGLKSFVASSELSKDEIKEIGLPCSVFSMGYLPVMNFCHCPVQHFTNCSCEDCKYKEYSLLDKFGEYKIRRIKIANCYFEMLNSNMHFIPKNEIADDNFACIDVTALDNFYEMVNNYLNSPCFILNNSIKLTRGQYLRGVK
ncbi:MAG: U32 family peptidase, partial [Clostridia bacterium]|nr:U32 family peptidase [Clostridia bacterium]